MSFFAFQVRFDEDVTSFFPDGKDSKKSAIVFKNLKVKDKIIVLFSAKDSSNQDVEPDLLIEASKKYVNGLKSSKASGLVKSVTTTIDGGGITQVTDYIYNNLPILLTDKEYARLDSMTTPSAIDARMAVNYNNLISPIGIALKDNILKDPLGLAGELLAGLQNFGNAASYTIYDGYLFSEDMSKMLIIVEPVNGTGSTGKNDRLVTEIESVAKTVSAEFPSVSVETFGGPIMGVYNARQIKEDTMITLTIAVLIIIIFISFAFKSRWAMVLITVPVLFGAIFALSAIYFITGSISAIAIGSGAAVFGIAMSYSIHVLSHRNHTQTVEQVIDELAYPLTIGSFTTIGAFLGLLFTSSRLLRDFGLFAALALVGTTIFCLVFLPHMLPTKKKVGHNKLLTWIEKVNGYRYDRNRWIVGSIGVLFAVCLFFYNDVRFDSDMLHLNYEADHLKKTEQKLNSIFNSADKKIILVSAHNNLDSALVDYERVNGKLSELKLKGKVDNIVSAHSYLIPFEVQKQRIERWNKFWTDEKRKAVLLSIEKAAAKYQFAAGSFDQFASILKKRHKPEILSPEKLKESPLFKEWISSADSLSMLVTQVSIDKKNKDHVYNMLKHDPNLIILDKGYFAQKMAVTVKDDFNLILYISSILIFAALLLSYGRIELALMSFLPMAISWIIILGLMALLKIDFNIVNIILSTFIFGIGDDFSIFIMDGLQSEYRSGKKMLASHKTAIFFSAFTTVVGMGALIFAQHPALKSISIISILGMAAVVMIAYTIQPILFRLFISKPADKGLQPYTLTDVVRTAYTYSIFVLGCITLQLLMLILLVIPVSTAKKRKWFHRLICKSTGLIAKVMYMIRKVKINTSNEDFSKPSVIVANHQSFIDIIILLSLSPKVVMVTNGWVWNSPFFGRIVRFADFYHAANGYESLVDGFKEKVAEGYSVVIFPEGTRSETGEIKRFHKGAFYLAEKLNIDILPIVLYGNGMAISKQQPFLVKRGTAAFKILNRISPLDSTYGSGYKERARNIRTMFRSEYKELFNQYSSSDNKNILDNTIKSYIFKGPVLEWYMRIKIRMENRYRFFDERIPRNASITDIGCGYGPLSFMLHQYSPDRKILGIDYDADKIAVAQKSYIQSPSLRFESANAMEYDLPFSDIFVINDMLHYLPLDGQITLLKHCMERLNVGGEIIVRDGDNQKGRRHRMTKLTEKFSTKILRFNKTEGELCFTSSAQLKLLADEYGFLLHQMENDSYTSNTIYIFYR